MTRKVFCRKYREQLEGLDSPPFPGPVGEDLYHNISKRAWEEWQRHQTMLINEKQLVLSDPESRRYLQEQMRKFFAGEQHDTASGYTPPGSD